MGQLKMVQLTPAQLPPTQRMPTHPPPSIFQKFLAPALLGVISLSMLYDFIVRGLFHAFDSGKTDFSDVYVCAWLWRHSQNFYDAALVTRTHEQLVHASMYIAPVYPPTTFVLVSPLTFLPWGWANFLWLLTGLAGIALTIYLLLRFRADAQNVPTAHPSAPLASPVLASPPQRSNPQNNILGIGNPLTPDLLTLALITLILSFNPLHQAYHLGNIALLVVPLSLSAIFLAEHQHDLAAGLLLGITAALKPQVALWILIYYLLQFRKKLILAAAAPVVLLVAIFFSHAISLPVLISSYHSNFQYWFAPGHPDSFTEGARPYHVNIAQVVIYQIVHRVAASNLIAHSLFLAGFVLWISIVWRARFRVPVSLALSSLLALSFISLYHSVSDVTLLTLALCWAVPSEGETKRAADRERRSETETETVPWNRSRILTNAIFLLLMLPGHSLLMRFSPAIASSITSSWWWNLFVARYFVWLLIALNIALLSSLWIVAANQRDSLRAQIASPTLPAAKSA